MMHMEKTYCVYIMTNRSKMLYTGITNNIMRRVYEHKKKLVPGFTHRYNITRLVHFEVTHNVWAGIRREKQIKGWLRAKKVALIKSNNPAWDDLSAEWFRQKGAVETLNKPKRAKSLSC